MPKNKRPNRKPGGKKAAHRAAADTTPGGPPGAGGGIANVKGAKSAVKTYGAPKSSRSPISPARTRGSARSQ